MKIFSSFNLWSTFLHFFITLGLMDSRGWLLVSFDNSLWILMNFDSFFIIFSSLLFDNNSFVFGFQVAKVSKPHNEGTMKNPTEPHQYNKMPKSRGNSVRYVVQLTNDTTSIVQDEPFAWVVLLTMGSNTFRIVSCSSDPTTTL